METDNKCLEKGCLDYKVGENDFSGCRIHQIYYQKTDFIIYRHEDTICYMYDKPITTLLLSKLAPKISEVTTLIDRKKFSYYSFKRFLYELAKVFKEGLEGHEKEANALLLMLRKKLIHYHTIKSRLNYIVGNIVMIIIGVICSIYVFNNNTLPIIYGNLNIYIYIATFGSLGGFISSFFQSKQMLIDINTNDFIYFFEGIVRILFSMVAAIVVFLIVKSNIILGILYDNEKNNYAIYSLAVLAGFSEQFIPSLLSSLKAKIDSADEKKQNTPDMADNSERVES